MKKLLIAATVAAAGSVALAIGSVEWGGREPHPAVVDPVCGYEPGEVIDLAGEWTFSKNNYGADRSQFFRRKQLEKEWAGARKIRVPGNWETQGVGEPVPAQTYRSYDGQRRLPLRHYFNGDGWYRRTVQIPTDWKGKRVWLKVGGVGSQGWFWIDGHPVAHVFDYCATRKYEITDLVTPGKSCEVIAEVTNAGPSKHGYRDSCCFWGGLTRTVELEATPETFIDDVWVRGDFDRRLALVNVEVGIVEKRVGGESRSTEDVFILRAEVDGVTQEEKFHCPPHSSPSTYSLDLALRAFRPWSPEHPNLYTARVELVSTDGKVLHARSERFGIRKLEVRGKELYLNNRPFFWRGVGFHEFDPINGLHPADRAFYRDRVGKIRACGFNAVRLHTRCEWPEFHEVADELGLLVQTELPYYGDHTVARAPFEPLADARELWENYRRYPSFAVYSGGNEGSFGPVLGPRFYREIKARDPDRLVTEQTTIGYLQWPGKGFVGTTDFMSQPTQVWERGSVNPEIPFLAHEYMNLAVKLDTRLEDRYTGAWGAPMTQAERDAWLAKFGLDRRAGDRLQDAQHALQAVWQKRGIESARKDPYCDGYNFWSMLDACCRNEIGWTRKVDGENPAFIAQGILNPFFEEKSGGQTMAGFARFNSPVGVFVDTVPEELQVRAGERVTADVLLANYGDDAMKDAKLVWRIVDGKGGVLASGTQAVGDQPVGAVRKIASLAFSAPAVTHPVAGRFEVAVGGHSNDWPCWLFPKRAKRDGRDLVAFGAAKAAVEAAFDGVLPPARAAEAKVVVADYGSSEAAAARQRGQSLVEIGGQKGDLNVWLGWWFMSGTVGATFDTAHPALKHLPPSPCLSSLHFRIFKKGLPLPLAGYPASGLVAVCERGDGCTANLAEAVGPYGNRLLLVYGLLIDANLPESLALLDGLVDRAREKGASPDPAKSAQLSAGVGVTPATDRSPAPASSSDGAVGGTGRD